MFGWGMEVSDESKKRLQKIHLAGSLASTLKSRLREASRVVADWTTQEERLAFERRIRESGEYRELNDLEKITVAETLAAEHNLTLTEILGGWHRAYGQPLIELEIADVESGIIDSILSESYDESFADSDEGKVFDNRLKRA
jgi:hypothetical protein